MARAFDVATATKSASLASSGSGEITFTISNQLLRDVRARATIVPDGKADAKWMTLDEAEKDLKADGTTTFTVRIAVPPGTAVGDYGLHLLVASVSNPDDEFADGPLVTFKVTSPAPGPKQFPWWIVAVAAAVIVVGGGVGYYLWSRGRPKLGEPCDARGECSKGLLCVTQGETKTCLAVAGEECKDAKDCASGLCKDGDCAEVAVQASCSAAADCDARQLCVNLPNGRFCLFKGGQSCRGPLDCASAYCRDDKTCADEQGRCDDNFDCRPQGFFCKAGFCRKVDGQPCTAAVECASGFCASTCAQPPPPRQCTPPCVRPLVCVNGRCIPILISPDRVLRQDLGRVPLMREIE